MRTTTLLLLAGLVYPSFYLASQDGTGQQEQNPYVPKPTETQETQQEKANAKLEADLQGAWNLSNYVNPRSVVPDEDAKGFALIHDGFLTIQFQATGDASGIFLDGEQKVVQASAFRYRIIEGSKLQLDGLIGFTNDNEDYELEFRSAKLPREYRVILTGDRLRLVRRSGVGFEFRRVRRTEFSQSAVHQLLQQEAGYGLTDGLDVLSGSGGIDDGGR